MSQIFGVGTLQISGTAGAFSIAKLQGVSLNITYESAQLRGGTDVFPCNTQFFDGSIEGSFEAGDVDLSSIAPLIGGNYSSAGGSGTMTITGAATPPSFKMVISGVTNGITSTITLHKVFVPSLTLDFSRTEYLLPSMNFICETSTTGLASWQL